MMYITKFFCYAWYVGEICAKQTSKAKDFLKAVFCYACSPEQPEFIGSPYNPDLFTNDTEEVVRVCKTAAIEIHPGKFSDCGMTLVAERGNIPAGDDTVSETLKTLDN